MLTRRPSEPQRRSARSRRRLLVAVVLLFVACAGPFGLLVPVAWAAAAHGNDIGRNVGGLLRHWAAELYMGLVAISSVVFAVNRRYSELAKFLLAAVVIAWLVFSPDQIATTARHLAKQIF